MPQIYNKENFTLQRNFLEVFLANAVGRNDELAIKSYERKLANLNEREQILIRLQELDREEFLDEAPIMIDNQGEK